MAFFKVLRGIHQGPDGRVYGGGEEAGDVVETDVDLVAKFNSPGSIKFQRLEPLPHSDPKAVAAVARKGYEEAHDEPSRVPLDSLTVQQLRRLAEEHEIDVSECSKKDEIINTLRAEGVEG